MKPHPAPSLLAALALLTLTAAPAFAAIVVTLPTATVDGSLVITQDINFTITSAGTLKTLVFDEWVTSDGANNPIAGTDISPVSLAYSLNSGSPISGDIINFYDNLGFNAGAISPNDGYILLVSPVTVALNDIFTVKAATYTLAAGSLPSDFNPQTQQTFTGNAFLADASGNRRSANTPVGAVPEPGSLGLLALGGLAAATRRRRRVVG